MDFTDAVHSELSRESFFSTVNACACKIQRWYRRVSGRRRDQRNIWRQETKRLLADRKKVLDTRSLLEREKALLMEQEQRLIAELRRRNRRDKAKAERAEAVEMLHQGRVPPQTADRTAPSPVVSRQPAPRKAGGVRRSAGKRSPLPTLAAAAFRIQRWYRKIRSRRTRSSKPPLPLRPNSRLPHRPQPSSSKQPSPSPSPLSSRSPSPFPSRSASPPEARSIPMPGSSSVGVISASPMSVPATRHASFPAVPHTLPFPTSEAHILPSSSQAQPGPSAGSPSTSAPSSALAATQAEALSSHPTASGHADRPAVPTVHRLFSSSRTPPLLDASTAASAPAAGASERRPSNRDPLAFDSPSPAAAPSLLPPARRMRPRADSDELVHDLTAGAMPPPTDASTPSAAFGGLPRDKLSNILRYLEEVDVQTPPQLLPVALATPKPTDEQFVFQEYLPSVASAAAPAIATALGSRASNSNASPLASHLSFSSDTTDVPSLYDGVKNKIKSLKAEIIQKDDKVTELTSALDAAREREKRVVSKLQHQEQSRLEKQRVQYEEAIGRHLSFIDRLLADKNELSQKCEGLTSQLRDIEAKYALKVKELEEQAVKDVKRQKDAWAAAEKVRREQWIAEKTKEIKEVTCKGLEPEIQHMISKHKLELRRAEEQFQQQLRKQREDMAAQNDRELQVAKERWRDDKEREIEKEREAGRMRLREQQDRYEQQLSSQRLRSQSDIEAELQRLEAQRRQDKLRFDEALQRAAAEQQEKLKAVAAENARTIEEVTRKHKAEVAAVKDKAKIELEQWQKDLGQKFANEFKDKEKALMQKLREERDAQIEMVIVRLEDEAAKAQAQMLADCDKKLAAATARHNAELHGVQEQLRMWKEKHTSGASTQYSLEEEVQRLKQQIASLKNDANVQMQKMARLQQELADARAQASVREKEMVDACTQQLAAATAQRTQVEEKLRAAQEQLKQEQSDRHRQLEDVLSRHSLEMDQLHSRVKQTVSKKDETIGQLRDQLVAADARVKFLDALLAKQKHDLAALTAT